MQKQRAPTTSTVLSGSTYTVFYPPTSNVNKYCSIVTFIKNLTFDIFMHDVKPVSIDDN